MEEQLTPKKRETSFTRGRDGLAYSPLLRGSGKRREIYNHPNIDAPFGFPHRSNRDITSSNTFTEYRETRPQTRDTIQGLVLDIQKVPFTHLNSREEEKWTCGGDPTGSQGSVFTSSPPVEPLGSVKQYGRQDSQSSVSTIGRLAAAATARVFPLDTQTQTYQQGADSKRESKAHDSQFTSRQSREEKSSASSSGNHESVESSRQSEPSVLRYSCPTTIVTISDSLTKAAQNAMNSAIYPALCSNGRNNAVSCIVSSPISNSSSFSASNETEKRQLLGHDEFYGHNVSLTCIPESEQTNKDQKLESKDMRQTPTSIASCINGHIQTKNCQNRDCFRCRARMLEPLSLAETECSPSSALRLGHVNEVYIPETPISPIDHDVFDTVNKRDLSSKVYESSKDANQVLLGSGVTDLSTSIRNSKTFPSHPSSIHLSYSQQFPQIHCNETQKDSKLSVSECKPLYYHNDKNLSPMNSTSIGAENIGQLKPTSASDIYLENNGSTNSGEPGPQFRSQNVPEKSNQCRLSPVPGSATSSVNSISHEEQYFSDSNQDARNRYLWDGTGSDFDDFQDGRTAAATNRFLSNCQSYQQNSSSRYRKKGTTGHNHQHPSSFSGSAAAKHKRSLQCHSGKDFGVKTSSSQKCLHHSAENLNFEANPEGSRLTLDPLDLHSDSLSYQHSFQTSQSTRQQQQTEYYQVDHKEGEHRDPAVFFLSDSNSLPPSPEVGLGTAAAMFIPAMATNLLPFPLPLQSNVTFNHKPVTKQQAKQLATDPDSAASQDKLSAEATGSTPRKKKTSLVALVRGRRSDKGKSKNLVLGKHNRSLSLNRSAGSSRGKVVMLNHQRSKEI